MNDPLDHRVTRLEFRVDGHDKDLSSIKEDTNLMSKTLKAIEGNLNQIKWIAVGAGGAWTVAQVGVLEIIKKLIGL
jgi:hypothetical protein